MENRIIKILVIDDTPDNLVSLKSQLNNWLPEVIVFTALNGAKGMELAALEDPDVILLDIVMPGMDGYELCKLLKADQKLCNIPVVFFTANKSDQESRIRALECGAEALLAKPIDPIELTAQIRAMVKVKDASIIKQKEEERLTQLVEEQVRELKENHTATLNLLEDLRNEVEIRKQREADLFKSELRFKKVSEEAMEWIWEVDTEGIYTYSSPVVETILGYKTSEIVGKKYFYDFFTPDLKENLKATAFEAFSRKESFRNFENPSIHKDGHVVILESNGSPITDSEGNLIGYCGVDSDITERRNSENRIREKDIQFRKLSANLPDMIYQFTRRTDGTYCVPVASEGIRNIYGLSPDDVIDDFTPIVKLIYPEDLGRLIIDIEYSAEHLTHFDIEYRAQIPGQEIKWVHCKSIPERLADGSITWYGFIMDITKRKQAEENLKHSEYNLSEAERIGNSGSWDYDVATGIASWSANMFRIFDVDPDMPTELVFNHFVENLVIPDDRPHILSIFQDALAGKRPYDLEYNTIKKDGSIRTIHAIADTLRDENGNAIRLMGKVEDITQRKQAELELIREKEHAEESETRLKLATFAGSLGIWDWNVKDNVMEWDNRMFELYGITKDTFPSNIDTWTNGLHPDDKQRALDECYSSLNSGNNFDTSFRVVHPNGKIIHVKADAIVIKEPDGKPLRMIGINKDISESIYAEEQLVIAKEHAEQSDRLKSAFLANMSHEIRTPMNGILGFSELLKEPGLTGEKQQEYIRIIEKSGARMLNIINNIVDISKIEANLMQVDIKETDINEKMEFIYIFFKPQVEEKGMQLFYKNTLPTKEVIIRTDSEKVYSILTNLVKNAIKYSNKGEIEFGYIKKGETLEFYVKDTGIGIPKDKQKAIFERFIQADIEDKMARQGAGLGLSISKAYVDMLGGNIWVESEEGVGSTFYFTLPYNALSEEKQVVQSQDSVNQINPEISKPKILIAEDDEASAMLIALDVEKFGKDIIKALDGFEAVEVCRNNPDIDLILMDIQMPVMNGYEATRQIRQFNKDVVIIAQTAFGLFGDREKAIEAGCNDYISKPINKDKLLTLIIKYFNK
jgi:PAS domain S-box-containing protein